MRTLFYLGFFLLTIQVGFSQTYFDGLLHEPFGPAETYVEDDKYVIVPFADNEVSGTDIILGETKGFRFEVSKLDPFELPDGAYSEWTMVGQANGMADQVFWTERHTVTNTPNAKEIAVSFDASPMGAELIQVTVSDVNGDELYSKALSNGILWEESFEEPVDCPPNCYQAAQWDATCVYIYVPPIETLMMGDGTPVSGMIGKIEYSPINPTLEPEFCSKVESRSFRRPIIELQTEGISMFENRIPFFELGDIIYETNLEFLKLTQIGDDATDGVRIPIEEETTFDIDFQNDFIFGDNFQLLVEAKGLIDNSEKDLGQLRQILNPEMGLAYLLDADFSGLGALKTIQIWSDTGLVVQLTDYDGSSVATLNNIPTGCGKRSSSLGPPPSLPCYYFEFDELTTFQLPGSPGEVQGNEIRVLSQTTETVTSLTEIQLRVADVDEFVITQAGVVTSTQEPQLAAIDFQVFPNPAHDELSIQLEPVSLKEPVEVQIFNNQGQLLLMQKATSTSITIPTAELPNGMYILQVKSDDKVGTQKFIRQ
jgi:hypothetical protein